MISLEDDSYPLEPQPIDEIICVMSEGRSVLVEQLVQC